MSTKDRGPGTSGLPLFTSAFTCSSFRGREIRAKSLILLARPEQFERPSPQIRSDGVGGSNPSCGTNKINGLAIQSSKQQTLCPDGVRKGNAEQVIRRK